MEKHFFISIEGIEGMGKTTVFDALHQCLTEKGIKHILTREPGGTIIAEAIRQILLSHEGEEMLPITEMLLMFASRAQHVDHVIKPALAKGEWVICDRFADASYAYQGGGRGLSKGMLDTLSSWTVDTMPDLTFLLDGPVDLGVERIAKRSTKDRIETEKHDFFERARQAYLDRAKSQPDRFVIIDASQSKEQVLAEVLVTMAKQLNDK